jgi:hypothetical protein
MLSLDVLVKIAAKILQAPPAKSENKFRYLQKNMAAAAVSSCQGYDKNKYEQEN